MANQSIITKTMFLDANGHRLKIWFIWDQINCVLRVIRVREVIGPDGGVKDVDGGDGSDGDQDGGDGGDINAMKFRLDKVGGQSKSTAGV